MRTWPQQNMAERAAIVIYGASMVTAFLTSALYHGVPFSNPVWHLFVVGGSTAFFFAITRIL
jgi:predicted membrane channel-forming protein YqfA (hemolysin III family)